MPKLGDRLSAARRRLFVGRASELALFQSALSADARSVPFYVLHIFGPGGVGKSALLNEFATQCQASNVIPVMLDARDIDPTPETFTGALRLALNLPGDEAPLAALAARPQRHALLIDTYEVFGSLDSWLRDSFLPELPENTLVVLAGRESPATAWQTDPGWSALVRIVPLRNLTPAESRTFLARRNIPDDQHQAVLSFTHGFPLALSLVADVFAQRPEPLREFQPQDRPDIIKTLLERFVQKVPGPAHRAALEACALVRVMTEALLTELLMMGGTPDGAHDLFDWLRGLSFIDARADGVFPHDLAREALLTDMHWRNPDWYAELHKRARNYYHSRISQASGLIQQRLLFDLIFLHRENPVVRPFLEWQASGSVSTEPVRAAEIAMLIKVVEQHEGTASAAIAAHWFARQPDSIQLIRDPDGRPTGFFTLIKLNQAAPADLAVDPAAQKAWSILQRKPLRAGETATLFRFWMDVDMYQAVSSTQSLIFVNIVRHYLTTPGLAFTFFPVADADFWSPMLGYANIQHLTEADYTVGDKTYGVYGHDWRAEPPAIWLGVLAEREVAAPGATPAPSTEAVIVLSETEFAAAVHDALRDLAQPDLMADNPLLRSRVVIDRAGAGADQKRRIASLQSLIIAAAETLQAAPRDAKLYRALYHTYFKPAPTQEQAAELLDVPFSTYRRHLKSGILRLTERLWQQEIGA
ncbi:MAG: ATP-binding protein [Chloroflexi bacterium]|nr:ATP-binding protein [Chloroflexota bacterium]